MFTGDRLAACFDVTLKPGAEPSPKKDESLKELAAPCAESFSSRLAFATCSVSNVSGLKAFEKAESIVFYFYKHESVFESDVELKQCLDMKGKWQAISKDSKEYQRWEAEERARRINKLSDRIAP